MLLALISSLFQAAPSPAVSVQVSPTQVLIERSPGIQRINFDFLFTGQTDDTLRLASIKLVAADRKGKPWYSRLIDENGSDPSIGTVPRRQLAGRSSLLIYNPFHTFPADVPLDRLRYEFTFAKGEQEVKLAAEVEPTDYRQPLTLSIPIKGRMLVFEGHDFYAHHRRFDYTHPILQKLGVKRNSGRYAHDLSLVDAQGLMYRGDGKRNDDWYSWGTPIHAPAAGTVVEIENGMPDYDVGNPSAGLSVDSILARPTALMGNHVMIDHGGGVFSRLFHMKKGSVRVKVGDRVSRGQVIGLVGFSGSVYTIHLHYEVGTGPGIDVDGLPAYFTGFRRVLGSKVVPVARGSIDTGDIVEQP